MQRLLYFVLVSASMIGCGSDPGALQVRWTIGAGTACDEAGIEQVRITLREEGGGTQGPFLADCDAGRASPFSLNDVEEGSYTIVLEGLDETDTVIYTGESSARYTVNAGKTTASDTIVLGPIPARLTIQWRFEDGRPCAAHEVEQISAIAFENDAPSATGSTACDSINLILADVNQGTYDVQVTGLNADGDPTYRFTEQDVEVQTGEDKLVDGVLIDCATIAGGCS